MHTQLHSEPDRAAFRAILSSVRSRKPGAPGVGISQSGLEISAGLHQTPGSTYALRVSSGLDQRAASRISGVSVLAWSGAESLRNPQPLPAEAWDRFVAAVRTGSQLRFVPSKEIGARTPVALRPLVAAAYRAACELLGVTGSTLETIAFGPEAKTRVSRIGAGGASFVSDLEALDAAIDGIWMRQATCDLDTITTHPESLRKLRDTWCLTAEVAARLAGYNGKSGRVIWGQLEALKDGVPVQTITVGRLDILIQALEVRQAHIRATQPGSLADCVYAAAGVAAAS